jgi:hypothetical protein
MSCQDTAPANGAQIVCITGRANWELQLSTKLGLWLALVEGRLWNRHYRRRKLPAVSSPEAFRTPALGACRTVSDGHPKTLNRKTRSGGRGRMAGVGLVMGPSPGRAATGEAQQNWFANSYGTAAFTYGAEDSAVIRLLLRSPFACATRLVIAHRGALD